MPLHKQLLAVFEAVAEDLQACASGKMILDIQSNVIEKFWLMDIESDCIDVQAMSKEQMNMMRQAIGEALARRRYWRRGQLEVSFVVRGKELQASVRATVEYHSSEMFGNPEKNK